MTETTQYIIFGVDRERFALSVKKVQEILDLQPISRLPYAPAYVLGLMDIRGTSLLVIDLRTKFGLEPIPPTNRTRVIIVEADIDGQNVPAGLVADCVFEVSDLGGKSLEPPPSIGSRWRADYIAGIGRSNADFVIVLDLNLLLGEAASLLDAVM